MTILNNQMTINLIFFIGAIGFSILINRLLLKFSKNLGVRTQDDLLRWSAESKPSVGGLSFFIVFLISLSWVSLLGLDAMSLDKDMLFGLFAASTLGFVIGLADDAYNTKPTLKFLGQLLTANVLITSGIYIELTPDIVVNYLFSVFWVIAIMNAVNMLDNMDGITASIAAAIVLCMIMLLMGQEGANDAGLIILLGVLAALIGFLFFNWHPSKMFMGDTGSQFLGAFLAGMSMVYLWQFREDTTEFIQLKQFVLPLLAFIIPIIDTTTVFIRRIARGQSPFVGGRDHTTHHLVYVGLRDGQVTALLLGISLVSVGLIYGISLLAEQWNYVYTFIVFGYWLVVFILFQVMYQRGKHLHEAQQEGADE